MLSLVMVLLLSGTPKADPKLAGRWMLEGEPFCTLKADGTGSFDEDPVRWGVDGGELVIKSEDETERVAFTHSGDTLTLNMGGIPLTLNRAGKGSKAGKASAKAAPAPMPTDDDELTEDAPAAKAPAQAKAPAGKDELSRLLLSSAWCSFSFNKVSGTTRRSRVRFFPDGTWSRGGQAETYTSGASGSVAGQYNNGDAGRWAVKGGQLYISDSPEAPAVSPVEPFSVTRNSSGYPIINAAGEEYSSCD